MKKLLQNEKGLIKFLPLLIVVSAVGIISYLLISTTLPFNGGFGTLYPKDSSHAAGTVVVAEVEAGTLGGNALNVSDPNVSGGRYVQFNGAQTISLITIY